MPAYPLAFSFDIEDWHHSELLPAHERTLARGSVVVAGTTRILDALRRHRVRGTFFVLGDVVRDHPELVRQIVDEGHELACHGVDHQPLWKLDADSFAAQLVEFRRRVEAVLGRFPVLGYRAPSFSLDQGTAWALDVLRDHGYAYDSSIFPARVRMYGVPGAPTSIYRPRRDDVSRGDEATRQPIVEFPVAVGGWGVFRLPVAGGFYLRTLPTRLLQTVLGRLRRRRPVALYLHPRECAPEAFRIRLPPVDAFITYVNLRSVPAKLEALLARHGSVTMRDALVAGGWLGAR